MSPESTISISFSLLATGISVWSIIRQDKRDRIQGTKIHEERAMVARNLYKLMFQYGEAFNKFRFQTNAEAYFTERKAAAEVVLQIYNLKQQSLFLFPPSKHRLLHDGIEALERAHRWTMDLGMAHWDAVARKVDPQKDERVISVLLKMAKDRRRSKWVVNRLHRFLRRSMGVDA